MHLLLAKYRSVLKAMRNTSRFYCARVSVEKYDLRCTRNIGIIAHIDAGKTTTTERMLYYAGVTSAMGEVHDGDTVMDYLSLERERGITITSAATTFAWKATRINLIDTPGHVDFTIEVERSLSVLDGSVAILDASAGVEAQTYTVWAQADRYKVPRIIYLNKMDKPMANMNACVQSVERKLGVKSLPIHIPLYHNKSFIGVIDLILMEKIIWDKNDCDHGFNFKSQRLDASDGDVFANAIKRREDLIGIMCELDETLSNEILSCERLEDLSVQSLQNAIRRITIQRLAFPVLCGSSYRNTGVQLLLDAIVRYLPSPLENVRDIVKLYGNNLCAFAFKIIFDKRLGLLTFLRIYSGEIKPSMSIYNAKRNKQEKIGKLFIAFADEFKEMPKMSFGNIAVVTGLTHTITGDTLVTSAAVAENVKSLLTKSQNDKHIEPTFSNIRVPEPVFYCTIEAPSLSKLQSLELALENLQKEDPSFTVSPDKQTEQIVIKGMGELHIEVIKDKILKEYNVDAYVGTLQVSYRETIKNSVDETFTISKNISNNKNYIKTNLAVRPNPNKPFEKVRVVVTKENDLGKIRPDYLKAIETGVANAFCYGPLMSFPVIDVAVDLLWFETTRGTTIPFIISTMSQCITKMLKNAAPIMLEPYMKLEITCPERYIGSILSDLCVRRSQICDAQTRGDFHVLNAFTPLAQLINYSTFLRTLTSGTAVFTMEFESYRNMSDFDQKNVIYQ